MIVRLGTKLTLIELLLPPDGAPNVLIDDVGFGASSAFRGPCTTPGAENLATGRLKYSGFHTTAISSAPSLYIKRGK